MAPSVTNPPEPEQHVSIEGAPGGVTPPEDGKMPTKAVEGSGTWSLLDRLGLALCWALGLLFCAIAVAITVYLFIQGIKFLKPSQLVTPAATGFTETETGGFSDAFFGTIIVATMGIALALPAGIAIAVWLVEYGRPAPLARITELTVGDYVSFPTDVPHVYEAGRQPARALLLSQSP